MDEKATTSELGKMGETVACEYLQKNGYGIIMRNYRCKYGEIDIIAEDERHLIFVEVKMRADAPAQLKHGRPANAINRAKKTHILNSVHNYLHDNFPVKKSPRVDVVEIIYGRIEDSTNYQFRIRHTKAAITENGDY